MASYDYVLDFYSDEVMNYSKILTHKIKSKKHLLNFFDEYELSIIFDDFLNDLMPFEEERLGELKHRILDDDDNRTHLFDIILISNEISGLIIDEHVEVTEEIRGSKIFKMDSFAVTRLNDKFHLGLKGNEFRIEDIKGQEENDDESGTGGITMSLN